MRPSVLLLMLCLGTAVCVAAQTNVNPTKTNQAKEATCVVSGIVIRKTDSAPLKGATVQLGNAEDREHTIATKTGADGHFELRNVPAGQYRLSAVRNGYFEYEYGQKKAGDPGATFTLRPGQRMTELVLKLGRAGVITGKVFDEDGEPMSGANISAVRQVYRDGKRDFQTTDEQITNDLGEYRLYGLAPGRYYVSSQPQAWNHVVGDREFSGTENATGEKGYSKVYYPSATDPTKATSIEVKEGEEIPSVDILMKQVPVYRIKGKVTNLIASRTAGHTHLQIMKRNGAMEWDFTSAGSVKPDGNFEIPEVPPGEYTVLASWYESGKFYSTQEDVAVANADVEGLMMAIGPGVDIPGKVVWEGKPSWIAGNEGVMVAPVQSGVVFGRTAGVGEDQQFTLKGVPQGVFRLDVTGLSKDCYIKEMRQGETVLSEDIFRVMAGTAIPLEIRVSSRGAKVQGTVTNEDSLPVAGVWVVAIPEEGKRNLHQVFRAVTTDQNAQYDLRGLAPGKYKLFSWDGVERGAWEDEDFLKPFEEKGVTVEVVDGDAKAADLSLIQLKDAASAKSE
jgi:hypothetical protein